MKQWLGVSLLALALVVAGCRDNPPPRSTARIAPALPSTPPGVTLVNVLDTVYDQIPVYLWTRLGDAQGRTLFISEADTPGVSKCVDDCAKEFPPLLAGSGASAFGDWSLIKRPEGTVQWAHRGKALYTFAKETRLDQVVDTLVSQRPTGIYERNPVLDPLLPPAGWNVANFDPGAALARPAQIGAKTVAIQNGMGDTLVTAEGMTLYGYDGSAQEAAKAACVQPAKAGHCSASFQPYLAPEAASAVGDFSLIEVGSGRAHQWAYKGIPLYTFSGDHKPTDAYGVYEDNGPWQVMFLFFDTFPQNVQAVESVGHDKILADARGMPLYQRAYTRQLLSSYTTYHGYGAPTYMGTSLRTGGCDAACLKVRHPLLAPADAQPQGDWTIYPRADGSRQWAFRGFALYTYDGDTRPGIVNGSNVVDYVVGDRGTYKVSDMAAGAGSIFYIPPKDRHNHVLPDLLATAFYWYVSHPDWVGR